MADKIDDAKFESMDSMERMQYVSELSEDEQKEFFDGMSEKDKVAWYNPDMTEEEVIQYLKDTNPDALLQEEKRVSDEDIPDMYMNDDAADDADEEDSSTSVATDEEDENDEDFEDDGSSKSSVRKRYEKFKTEEEFMDEAAKQYERLDKIHQDLEKVNGWIADEKAILKKDRKNTFAQNALDGHQEQVVDLQHQMSRVYNDAALLQTMYNEKYPGSDKLNTLMKDNKSNNQVTEENDVNNRRLSKDSDFKSNKSAYNNGAKTPFDVESYNRFANAFGDRAAAELNDISEKYQAIAQVALNNYSKFDEMFHAVGLDLDKLHGAPIATGSPRLNRLHRQRVKLERTKGQTLDTYGDLKNPLLQQAYNAVDAAAILVGETTKYTNLMIADPFLRHLEEEGSARGVKAKLLDFSKDVYSKDATKGAEKIEKELTNPIGDVNIEKDDLQKGQTGRFRQFLNQIKSRFSGQGAAGVDDEEVQGNNTQETEKDEESKDATTVEENVNSDDKKEDVNPGSNKEMPDEIFDNEDDGYSDDFDDDSFVDFGDEYEDFSEESGDERSDENPEEKTDEESSDERSDENPEEKIDEKLSDERSDENPEEKIDEKSSDERSDDGSENKKAFGEQPSNEESSDKTSDDEFGDKPSEENFDDNAKKIHMSHNGMMLMNQHIARRDGEFESQEVALSALDEQFDYIIDSARVRYREACAGSSNEKEAEQLKEEIRILSNAFSKDVLEGEATQNISKTLRPSKLVDLLDINQQLRSELTKDPEYKLDIDIKLNKDGKELAGNTNEFKEALGIVEDAKTSENVESAKEARLSKLAQDARYQKVLSYARNAKDQNDHDGKNGPSGPV